MDLGRDVELTVSVAFTVTVDLGIMAERMGVPRERLERQIANGAWTAEDVQLFTDDWTDRDDWVEVDSRVTGVDFAG